MKDLTSQVAILTSGLMVSFSIILHAVITNGNLPLPFAGARNTTKQTNTTTPQGKKEAFISYAETLKLNKKDFEACVNTDKYKEEVQADATDGGKLQVTGTPTLFVNGIKLVGARPYESLKEVIENELNGRPNFEEDPQTGAHTTNPVTRVEVSADNDPQLGKNDAPVKIIEFSDFQCPFCKRLVDQSFTQLKTEYIDTGKVSIVFRDYPLSFHKNAEPAAIAAECAKEQGKFWEYHDVLFQKQDEWGQLL